MKPFAALRLIGIAAVFAASTGTAYAVEIKMIASNAVKEAYGELLPAYEKASGNTVTVSWGGTGDIVKRVDGGEVADIVIVTDFAIDGLIRRGKLMQAGNVVVAKSPTGAGVRTGAAKPDLSSADGFKTYLLGAKGIVLTAGPSNPQLHKMLEKLGIAAEMKAKEVHPAPGQALTDPVVSGAADIIFTQGSELMTIKGIDYAGPFPPGLEVTLVYKAAYGAKAPQLAAAKALVAFLTAPGRVKVLKENGLEPG
jgi:molybdate transport system substrate-binding protein